MSESEQPPEEVQRRFSELTEVLKDEDKRRQVDELLDSFSHFDRTALLGKVRTFARYLGDICGQDAITPLLTIVSQAVPEVESSLKLCDDENVREWLKALNRKYIAAYEGVFPPFVNDWYRVLWTTRLDSTHNIPFIEIRLLKRNGESVYLDMPFHNAVGLMIHQLEQMESFQKKVTGGSPALGMKTRLERLKQLADSIIRGPVQESTDK